MLRCGWPPDIGGDFIRVPFVQEREAVDLMKAMETTSLPCSRYQSTPSGMVVRKSDPSDSSQQVQPFRGVVALVGESDPKTPEIVLPIDPGDPEGFYAAVCS